MKKWKKVAFLASLLCLFGAFLIACTMDPNAVPAPESGTDEQTTPESVTNEQTDSENDPDEPDGWADIQVDRSWDYRVLFDSNGDGTCTAKLKINPFWNRNFEVVIPEKSPEGDTVTALLPVNDFLYHPRLPEHISEKVFLEKIETPLLQAIENGALGGVPKPTAVIPNPTAKDSYYYRQFMSYYDRLDLTNAPSDESKNSMLLHHPMVKKTVVYFFEPWASDSEMKKIRDYFLTYCTYTVDDFVMDYTWMDLMDDRNMPYYLTGITLPSTLICIPNQCFQNCSNLKSVVIADGITRIGAFAFQDCVSLATVSIPDSVTHIGVSAFQSCDSLTEITIPDSVQIIGIGAFAYSGLKNLTLTPKNVVADWTVFGACSDLERIQFSGTKAQWAEYIDPDYFRLTKQYTVYCTDGELTFTGQYLG